MVDSRWHGGWPAALLILFLPAAAAAPVDRYESERNAMVIRQLQGRDIQSPVVLRVMRKVPRHLFVPEEIRGSAYHDGPLPIGYGQTISQPYIVAFMSEQLDLDPTHKVLEIGTGSGYQAAVLGELAGEVYTIEIVEELGMQARRTLAEQGYTNVHVRIGNGYLGWPEEAPFDRIILTAAPEQLPEVLVEQLKPGGRLVAPVGPRFGTQHIIVLDKSRDGKINRRSVLPVAFVPMVHQPDPKLR